MTVVTQEESGKPYLTWSKIDGAGKHEVQYATESTLYETLYTTTNGNHVRHGSAVPGETYYYRVRAYDEFYSEHYGHWSTCKCATCRCAAPETAVDTRSDGKPVLTWEKIEGAEKYEVYCSTDGDDFTHLITANGTRVNHTSAKRGHTYRYKVRALAKQPAGNSAWSYYDTVKVK